MMTLIAYFAVTLSMLLGLASMIALIARSLALCPESTARARVAGMSVATGFVAIGGGAVLLIATLASMGRDAEMLIFAMGLACLVLGLGFAQAMNTLRAVVQPAAPKVPMDPVRR
jgi:hypothetical protein